MNFLHVLFFLIIDSIIHHFVVIWEVNYNKDLFIDLELIPWYKVKKKDN